MIKTPIGLVIFLAACLGPTTLAAQDEGRRQPQATFVGVEHTYTYFEGATDPWSLSSTWITHRRHAGTFSARLNLARRFGTNGEQFEFDAYPRLTDKAYLYLNGAFSPSKIFPRNREAVEIFGALPKAWEASAGVRALHFQFSSETIWLFTGSIGKYYRNDWYSFRPYVRSKDGEIEFSGTLNARRYLDEPENYYGLRVGYGTTPSDRVLTDLELGRNSSATAGAYLSRTLVDRTLGTLSLDFTREELTPTTTRKRWDLLAGVRWQF